MIWGTPQHGYGPEAAGVQKKDQRTASGLEGEHIKVHEGCLRPPKGQVLSPVITGPLTAPLLMSLLTVQPTNIDSIPIGSQTSHKVLAINVTMTRTDKIV